ncbi:MAG: HU family DNA-binding protein [Ruminococcus sp.]|jgi:DNA-binding protein HU-1|nr:HU family DNA-binding protein [Ruminococcus sp.]MDD6300996.1 HU family DNA-binding protein [Ruminococcus sp.]MDD7670840.1 HU family DNA-binding protein [Ruminococcus sp.]MDY2742604.1 HU family DNA-binding protein [Eubacteriales bacterium]CDD04810.1 dNA-binding protein HU-1 [Ruminococcus sp. CAG:382]
MNKTNLIDIVAEKADLKKKDAEAAVNAVFAAIEKDLKEGGKIQIAGFGSFKVKERSARVGRNPKTLEQINIPASKSPVFVPGKNLKDAVNG